MWHLRCAPAASILHRMACSCWSLVGPVLSEVIRLLELKPWPADALKSKVVVRPGMGYWGKGPHMVPKQWDAAYWEPTKGTFAHIDTASVKTNPAALAHEIGHHILRMLGKQKGVAGHGPGSTVLIKNEREAWAIALKMFRDAGVKPTQSQLDLICQCLVTYHDPKSMRHSGETQCLARS